MIITNTHKQALAIPGGVVLQPNVATPVANWEAIKNNRCVKAWIAARVLLVAIDAGGPSSLLPDPDEDDAAKSELLANAQGEGEEVEGEVEELDFSDWDKDDLKAKLDELKIAYNPRWGRDKLEAALAEGWQAASSPEGEEVSDES